MRLASFFLSQVLGQTQSTSYSYIDDLPSLDEELYRSLMYIKHYDSDVADLSLIFSTTGEFFGVMITTRELVPGGKAINVTNSNKSVFNYNSNSRLKISTEEIHKSFIFFFRIIYIHLMAHFRMHTQIKQQTIAFARGFHCIFSSDSLALFSVPEVRIHSAIRMHVVSCLLISTFFH